MNAFGFDRGYRCALTSADARQVIWTKLMVWKLLRFTGVVTIVALAFSEAVPASAPVVPATRFSICRTGGGMNCVVDGDTAWIGGVKIRIADIDAPETHLPRCRSEAILGERATRRLRALLSEGSFELFPSSATLIDLVVGSAF